MTPFESYGGAECVSALACSWPSVCRSAQRPRFDPKPRVVSSCDQLRIGDPLVRRGRDQAVEPVQRRHLDVAVVQPEGEFVDVAAQVLGAGMVIGEHGEQLGRTDGEMVVHGVLLQRLPCILNSCAHLLGRDFCLLHVGKAPVSP